jgi:hypothetical protein
MLSRSCCFVALVASLFAAGGKPAVACDRAVALVQPQVFGFSPAQVASPIVVAPLAVTPLTVVPLEAPAVVLEARGRGAVALRAVRVASRPVVVRPSRARSVTRVRTVVR